MPRAYIEPLNKHRKHRKHRKYRKLHLPEQPSTAARTPRRPLHHQLLETLKIGEKNSLNGSEVRESSANTRARPIQQRSPPYGRGTHRAVTSANRGQDEAPVYVPAVPGPASW